MKWFEPFPIDLRTGATFVHDWFALGIWIVGRSATSSFALRDPDRAAARCCAARCRRRWATPQATALVRGRRPDCRRRGRSRATDARGSTRAMASVADRDRPPTIVLPAELRPVRRPVRLGPVEGAPRGRRRARRRRAGGYLGTSHRRDGVRSVVRRVRDGLADALRAPRRLRGAARQRRHDRVLGRRRVRAHRAAQPAPRVRRVLVEVRRGHPRRRRTSTTPR